MIDTLKYTKDLEATGLNRKQAETIVGAQFKMISENVATKSDLKLGFRELDHKFTVEIQKVITKLGITVVASVTALGVFLRLLIKFF